ncbi:MAG TPA: hypothetical protein PK453_22020 [Leptospiraceae bacterium]|nr:hypothetical protein [Leptospiraceae bacterium]HMY66836.1 hypothetical protein [Leptospiraceae bacterium]HNF16354.1 hypothetical protein [Leptospiraceae bacterium]HNF24103.1 hypothetical protein [Leptospiraceae bacterium]HNI24892.1 hypothetical protein [Leptospiraceae bacterium]
MKKIIIGLIFIMNCHTTEIIISKTGESDTSTLQETKKEHLIVMGLWSLPWKKYYQPKCEKPVKIVMKRDALDSFLHVLLGGIYTPRTTEIYCEQK